MEDKWYSINDKLPSNEDNCCIHDYVLVYSENKHLFGIAQLYDSKWIMHSNGVRSCDIDLEMESIDITHWKYINYPKE